MRWFGTLCVVCLLAAQASAASAADMNDNILRGSFSPEVHPNYMRWDGFSFGGTIGYSNLGTDSGTAAGPQIAYILRNSTLQNEFQPSSWTALPKSVTNSMQYGGFVGYNWQMQQLVFGVDLAYNHPSSLDSQTSDSIVRRVVTSDNITHDVTLDAASSFKLIDYATVRGRVGYAFSRFLPYAMVGVALGRFDYSTSVAVTDVQSLNNVYQGTFTQSSSEGRSNVYTGGFLVGVGMDYAVLPNVFLRAEWEYITWGNVNGIKSSLNTGRAGIGIRF